jgi:hypothetical protein
MFTDYTQAFDSIERNKVLECLIQYNIATKLQKLTALTLVGTNAIVKINNEFTDKFDLQTEGQTRRPTVGYPLQHCHGLCITEGQTRRPTVSYPLQHCHGLYITENGNERKYLYQIKQCTAYADDILISTERHKQRQMHLLN